MGQRNIVCTSEMLDREVDEQSQGQLNPDPRFHLGSIAHYPHPNIYPILLAPVSTNDHDLCPMPEHYVSSAYYGVPLNGLLHHPVTDGVSGASSSYSNPYMIHSSASRICPLPLNYGLSDQLSSSSNHGTTAVGAHEYEGNSHFMSCARTANKSKNADGISRNGHHINGSASSSSSSLAMPLNAGLLQSEGFLEPGAGMIDATGFVPPDHRANGTFPITESGYRSRSGTLGFRPISTPHHQRNLVQGCYMGQSFQPTGGTWVEQRFESSGSDLGTSAWNYGPAMPYLHAGRVANEGPSEILSMGLQRYSDTMNSGSTFLPHPTMHHHVYYPAPLMQVMRGHNYGYHPQASVPSYRHPTSSHPDTRNPPVDPRPFQPIDVRISRSHHTGSRHTNRPFLRILPEDEVGILEIPGFYEVGSLNDPHQDMRLDIDDMSYEDLLALGGRIGNVKAGLSEDNILSRLKTRIHSSSTTGDLNQETCTVCQDEYETLDQIGTLDCGHEYHAGCIKQWLQVKDMCPICKTPAFIKEDGNG